MRLTTRGVTLLTGALVLLLAGIVLGMPLLRGLAGFVLAAIAVSVIPMLGRIRATVHREIHPDRVQRGTPAVAQLIVTNASTTRQPAFVARDLVGKNVIEVAVRALPAGVSARQVYELPSERRGRVNVGPLVVERTDLLGLARTRNELGEVGELFVYPRRHAVRLPAAGRPRHHHEGDPPPFPVRGAMDLRALREYVVGDELRHLHWKATARTGQLMVREYVDPAQPWGAVLLDDRASTLDPDRFEEAVEVVASLLWEAGERDQPTRFCTTSGTRIDNGGGPNTVRAVLDRLCALEQVEQAEIALDLDALTGARGAGWFAFVGAAAPRQLVVAARRFGRAIALDLGSAGSAEPSGLLTVRAEDAASAIRGWNAVALS
jgi:uncharacterized protein (DUF58 family)